MGTTYELFQKAERIEAVSAAIYGALARQFGDDADARALFARLEAEEIQHAARVRLLAARYRHDPKLLERVASDARELDALLEDSLDVLARVEAGTWARGLAETKRELAALEERLARAHADLIAREGHPALRQFFEALAAQDDAHERLLGSAEPPGTAAAPESARRAAAHRR